MKNGNETTGKLVAALLVGVLEGAPVELDGLVVAGVAEEPMAAVTTPGSESKKSNRITPNRLSLLCCSHGTIILLIPSSPVA